MTSTVPSVETIKEGFPYPSLPKQTGEPTYESIYSLHTLLKANAASISSELGGGAHGLLGLVLDGALYQTLTGLAFARPANPGNTPIFPARAGGDQTRRIERDHRETLRVFREITRTDQALQQQLLSSVDDMYLKALKQPHLGYTNRTCFDLLTHLYDNYGQISQIDLSDNESRMKTSYDISTPIQNLFTQIDDAIEYAVNGNAAFTAPFILTTAYVLVYQTGELTKACEEWDDKPAAHKTWDAFKTHFTTAHQRFKRLQRLKQSAFGSNSDLHANNIQQLEIQQETANAIHALADATSSDRTAVANLTTANHTLTSHLKAITATVKALEDKIDSLEAKIDTLLTKNTNRPTYDRNCTAYCYTHGRTFNPRHTSKTCNTRKADHKENATLRNRMGGSNKQCGDDE